MNSDPIAAGLSPFAPERETVQAGKLMLRQIDKLVERGESFCIETTLAGRGYAQKMPHWKSQGYTVAPMFLALSNSETTIARVAAHVRREAITFRMMFAPPFQGRTQELPLYVQKHREFLGTL